MEDGGKCEEVKQSTLEFKCVETRDATETKRFESVVTSTPEKASERLVGRSKVEEAFELPARYKTIVELFRQMTCSLRLLRLRKKSTTFRNVCPQVEILAKRKFSYKDLGQIKYILPEAVQIQKIIVHDEESQCMKPDLKINLVFDVVKDHRHKSDFIALCHLFFSRVVDFICTHSEGSDIPEASLPQPFSQDNESASSELVFPDSPARLNSRAVDIDPIEQVHIETVADQRLNSLPTPTKHIYSVAGRSHACDSPLASQSSEAANLMVETPAQLPPKRAMLETVESPAAMSSKALTLSEKPAKRSLDFTFETADRYVLANALGKTEDKPKESMTDRKVISNEEEVDGGNSCPIPGLEENDESTKLSCKMTSSLCGFVPIIHQIFRSVDYSPITKQELVFKILISSLDIDERGVVEEHLEQLELLLPNWISKRTSSSGDLMYSIKKLPDVSALLAELES